MKTPFLYDQGEEGWHRKLHLGCGTIYLQGYINVDIQGTARDPVELSKIQNYYGRKQAPSHLHLPERTEIVCDLQANIDDLRYENSSVDKIVCVQAAEHLLPRDAVRNFVHWWNLLKPGRPLYITVPDTEETIRQLKSAQNGPERDFLIRHLTGSLADPYSVHTTWWTQETLYSQLVDAGFDPHPMPNIHLYPAICVRATKVDSQFADRPYQNVPALDTAKAILDVGPGAVPFKGATHWIDIQEHPELDIPGDVSTVEAMPYRDGQFDVVVCSHVLEHIEEPLKAIRELRRVARAGYIECPSYALDLLFQQSGDHRWSVMGLDRTIVFVERPNRNLFACGGWEGVVRGIFQYRNTLSVAQIQMREHLWSHYAAFNVSVQWSNPTDKIMVVVQYSGKPLIVEEV